jgi:hypothetical protein
MMILTLLAIEFSLAVGIRHGHRGILDGIDLGGSPSVPPFVYKPSNINTRAPSTFADDLVIDDAYHDLVPALAVLSDLTTTTVAPNQLR